MNEDREPEAEEPRDHLLIWRSTGPLDADAAMAILSPLEHAGVLIGDAEGVAADWEGQRVGCVVVKGEPTELEGAESLVDWDRIPFPGGVAVQDGELVWVDEPIGLPAAPLVVEKGRDWRFAPRVTVELDFEKPGEDELALLEELSEIFLEAYRGREAGALAGAALVEGPDGGRTLTLEGWVPPDEAAARAHLHWWIEEIARFLPLRSARIQAVHRAARSGLAPSWIGPLVVIAAVFGTRLLGPSIALRASCLVWLFGPLMITFLSRAHVGRITWAVTVVNALVQAALAFLVERPDLVVGGPSGMDTQALLEWNESVRSLLQYLLYGSGAMGLVWVLAYLANRRRPL